MLERMKNVSRFLDRAFPMPRLLAPPTVGIDISDASIKWLSIEEKRGERRVRTYGEYPLSAGLVESGVIKNVAALAEALESVRKEQGGITAVHACLPEEPAYGFSMYVPSGTPREQVQRMIEFEFEGRVPIPPTASVYDYNRIGIVEAGSEEIAVSVLPREVVDAYIEAFDSSGFTLLSLEVEARSVGRAISLSRATDPVTLVIDVGRGRTGFAVLKHGIPIFTSTVDVGGDSIMHALMEKVGLSEEAAETYKNDIGLLTPPNKNTKELEAGSGAAATIADEVVRHYHYWDTRRNEEGNRMSPVERVVLVGGNANLKGLTDYISGRIQARAERANVWQNVATFEEYIPPIAKQKSLQYATAVGLALREFAL